LADGLQALIRFHKSHPDWFAPVVAPPPPLDPEWEAAIQRAYHPAPVPPETPLPGI